MKIPDTSFAWTERDYPPGTIDLVATCGDRAVSIMVSREFGVELFDLIMCHVRACMDRAIDEYMEQEFGECK